MISIKVQREAVVLAERYEYIRFYWQYIDEETPVILFYEVDLDNERYARRALEVFADRRIMPIVDDGAEFVTEAPVPPIEEIDQEEEFFAERITPAEFEAVYNSTVYDGRVCFDVKELKRLPRS